MSNGKNWSRYLIWTTTVACLASIQYGYHMAELNSPGAVLSCQTNSPIPGRSYLDTWMHKIGLRQCITMDESGLGLITSIFSIGGLVSSIYAGAVADKLGRKLTSLINSLIFFIGSLIIAFANNFTVFAIGRFIAGFGAGSGIVVTPLLINEISPNSLKGRLGSMNQVAINLGILLTQVLAIKWANDLYWRYLLFAGAVLAALNFIALLFIEESPKWLRLNGHDRKAKLVSIKLNGDYAPLLGNIEDIDGGSASEQYQETDSRNAINISSYIKGPVYRNSLVVVTALLAGQQFCGINSIVFYGVNTIRKITTPNKAVVINCLISLGSACVTFFSAPLIDKYGRKPCLVLSVGIMGVSSVMIAIGTLNAIAIISVIFTSVYVSAFAIGLGPIPFLMIPELTQIEARGAAQSYGTSINWLATFLVGYFFPILDALIGGYVYLLFALICGVFFLYLKNDVPETKGYKTYEEVWSLPVD
ncbi:hypothetical protein WICMUC_004863 [Wickerhamomyces mucosus]|uniref:Major facilitator superfamily (MFS) profile domain-containing protein n=1 Tax=Wickerhamomyces mucosus TaxID=1378264 RepID=A0A9P8T980_9ASCO|nr:hypothetical protein WICMUC_004863 [Wickerhamomyces mucosus]